MLKYLTSRLMRIMVALILGAVIAYGVISIRAINFQSSISALIPASQEDIAIQALSKRYANRMVFLVSHSNLRSRVLAYEQLKSTLQMMGVSIDSGSNLQKQIQFLRPFRENFLSAKDKQWLTKATNEDLYQHALRRLYSPASYSLLSWEDDPLGLFEHALRESNKFSKTIFLERGIPAIKHDGKVYLLLFAQLQDGLTLTRDGHLSQAITETKSKISNVEIICAGVPYISEVATDIAKTETTTIGLIATISIVLMLGLLYRSLVPLVCASLTLAVAFFVGLIAVFSFFGSVHWLTLLFGTTLLGVALDYLVHFVSATQVLNSTNKALKTLIKPLSLSLLTTVCCYCIMFFTGMPVIAQMAAFTIAGLITTFCVVVFFFPLLKLSLEQVYLAEQLAVVLFRFPRLKNKLCGLGVGVLAIVIATGIFRLEVTTDLRNLRSVPIEVLQSNARAERVLGISSPSQFVVIHAKDERDYFDSLARLEEKLTEAQKNHWISSYELPSSMALPGSQQTTNRQVVGHANSIARQLVMDRLNVQIRQPSYSEHRALELRDFESLDGSKLHTTNGTIEGIVSLSGIDRPSLPALQQLFESDSRFSFVNATKNIETLLEKISFRLCQVIGLAVLLAAIVLLPIYKKTVWRILLPPALSIVLILGANGWLGRGIDLFSILPLFLILGLGFDYSILLSNKEGELSSHASLPIAVVSTLLSFAFLGLTSVPALQGFGVTVLVGLLLVFAFALLLRE